MQIQMQFTLEAKSVYKGMWNMLSKVQMCATRYLWQQRDVWQMLHRNDHSRKQDQVPLINSILFLSYKCVLGGPSLLNFIYHMR